MTHPDEHARGRWDEAEQRLLAKRVLLVRIIPPRQRLDVRRLGTGDVRGAARPRALRRDGTRHVKFLVEAVDEEVAAHRVFGAQPTEPADVARVSPLLGEELGDDCLSPRGVCK